MCYSVLMTVFDGDNAGFFEMSIKSILTQTLQPAELVIVKDGPVNSGLNNVINRCKDGTEINIIEIQLDKNHGLGYALNVGIHNCSCELIARMDADDISLPTRCEKQVAEFQKDKKLDIVGSPVLEFANTTDNIVGLKKVPLSNEEIYKFAKLRDPFNHPTVMFKKSTVLSAGNYSDLRKNQDTDLWIKMIMFGSVCKNIEEPLLYFRFDEGTYKKRKSLINTKTLLSIRYKAYRLGFCSIFDFATVAISQLTIYFLPIGFQKFIYKNILRR